MSLQPRPLSPPIRDVEGVLRVGQTGVTVETVLWAFLEGATPEDIVDRFPTLHLADVYEVIAYYLRHPAEADGYLNSQAKRYREAVTELRRQIPETTLQRRIRGRARRR